MKDYDNLSKVAIAQLLVEYKSAFNELKSKVAQVYEKYSVNGVLTFDGMQKYNRLTSLMTAIKPIYARLAKVTIKQVDKLLNDEYKVGFLTTGFQLEINTGKSMRFGLLNENLVNAAINNQISGMAISERVKERLGGLVSQIRQNITQGLIQGESYWDIAKRLKGIAEKDVYMVRRIVNTEAHRVQNQARQDGVDRAATYGITTKKTWLTVGDQSVRDQHIPLDGKEADKDGLWWIGDDFAKYPGGFAKPENSINCRCTFSTEPIKREPIESPPGFAEWLKDKGYSDEDIKKIMGNMTESKVKSLK